MEAADEIRLEGMTYFYVNLVRIDNKSSEAGRIELRVKEEAPKNFINELGQALRKYHGKRWMVSVVDSKGEATMAEKAHAAHQKALTEVRESPLIAAAIDLFPEIEIVDINATLEE